VAAGVGEGCGSDSLGVVDVVTGTAGVLGCGCSVAVVGSSVVSVVICVTGAAGFGGSGLTGGTTSVTAGIGDALAGVRAAFALWLARCRRVPCVAAAEAAEAVLELVGWGWLRTTATGSTELPADTWVA
jgi:hypothetical protein